MSSDTFGPSLREPAQATPGRNLHEMVVNRLGLMIATGELPVNSQILPETVGTELGTSRAVVREALRVLEAKGMVHPRPRVGTRVLPPEAWDLLDEQVIRWRVSGPDRIRQLVELMELRVAVETSAVQASCRQASAADLALLGESCTRMREAAAADDLSAFTRADIEFHHQLLRCSGNLVYLQFQTPFAALLRARQELRTLPEHIGPGPLALHAQVVEAIAAHDAPRATEAITGLIEGSRAELLDALGAAAT